MLGKNIRTAKIFPIEAKKEATKSNSTSEKENE
jgi:hypothetical protein